MGPRSTGRNILIVDDDDDVRRLIHLRLAEDPRTGMVWEATDPQTASALVQILAVDVIILDHVLAQGTATDCLGALRQHRPDCRIIVYTEHVQLARESKVLDLGADHLVQRRGVGVDDIARMVFGSALPFPVTAASGGPSRDRL